MSGLYHTRGLWRGLVRQPAWHLREWFRDPAYRALHRFHRQLAGLARFTPAEVFFEGWKIRVCDGPSFLSAWDEIFVNRIYEVPPNGDGDPCLVDAGANIGLAALFWKWRYGRFRYLGIEPDPVVATCCRENLRAWRVEGELIEEAVAGAEGTSVFLPDGADGGRILSKTLPDTPTFTVMNRRLSGLLPARVDLLKIDVEGSEAEVIQDIKPHLGQVRALFVEWHSRSGRAGLGVAIDQLESAGYDCYVQVASGPSRPFLSIPPQGQFSQHLNLYAVRP